MNRPDDLHLSREEGEALLERLDTQTITAADCQVLAQVVRLYFWLLFALQETKLSLHRFRLMIFGDKAPQVSHDHIFRSVTVQIALRGA